MWAASHCSAVSIGCLILSNASMTVTALTTLGIHPPSNTVTMASSRQRLAMLEPVGELFVNGLASAYDDEFPVAGGAPASTPSPVNLAEYMTAQEFERGVAKINDALQDHWPCLPCTTFAYGCCICTLGLSFYCATTQVREAEARVQLQLRRLNDQPCFKTRGIEWRLVRVWYRRTSYIEIIVASDAPPPHLLSTATNDQASSIATASHTTAPANIPSPPEGEVMDRRDVV